MTGSDSGIRQRMLGGATVGCVQSVDDDAGDVALTGSMGRSDLL